MTNAARTGQGGFTLLETLVALSILSLMSLLSFGALKLGSMVWMRAESRVDADMDARVVREVLKATIERAYPALLRSPDGRATISFFGTSDALELTAPLPHQLGLGGFHRVRFQRVERGGRFDLEMISRLERNAPAMSDLPGPDARVTLVSGVTAVAFSYLGPQGGSDHPTWRADWHDRLALPRLVSVNVRRADGRAAISLVAAPQIDVDATCIFDPLTRGCRGR